MKDELSKSSPKQLIDDLLEEIGLGTLERKPSTEDLIRSYDQYLKRHGKLTDRQDVVLRKIHAEHFR